MGRPREHNADTAQALLAAGERLAEREGVDALSVRRLANEVGTTTRAVYSLFGSMDGLVVALGARAFELLGGAVAALAETKDPVSDLVEAGLVFREFSLSHPSLFRIAVQRTAVSGDLAAQFRPAAAAALAELADGSLGCRKTTALVGGPCTRVRRSSTHCVKDSPPSSCEACWTLAGPRRSGAVL